MANSPKKGLGMDMSSRMPGPARASESAVRSEAASLQDILGNARREYDAGRLNDVVRLLQPVLAYAAAREDDRTTSSALASAWSLLARAAVRTEQADIGESAAARAAAAFDELQKRGVDLGPDEFRDAVPAYYLAHRADEAAEWAQRAAAEGASPETYMFQGLAERDLGHHEDAAEALTRADGVAGADLQQRRLEALVAELEALGPDRAAETAEAYQELSRFHYDAGRYREALAALDRAFALGLRTAEAFVEKGEILRLLGDDKLYDQAVAAVEEALRLEPDYAWGHAVHGATLTAMDDLTAAEMALRKAIDLDASVDDWHYLLGDILRSVNRLDEALQSLDRALQLNPNHVAAHTRRGETLRRMGRYEEALAELNLALALSDDKDTFALASKGELLKQMGKEHWAEAERALVKAVELSPDGYEFAETSLGDLWLDRGREAEAVAVFDRVLKSNPDYGWALEGKARALIKLDQVESGLGVTHRLLELDPDSGWAHAVTGAYLFLVEDYQGSAREFQRGTELKPEMGWAQDSHAEACIWLARFGGEPPAPLVERALAASRKAVELSPEDLSSRATLGDVLWMLGGARRAEAEAEYQRVLNEARATESLGFYAAAAAGWSAVRLASLAADETSRPLLAEAERCILEALATKSDRPSGAESIAAKLNLGLLMLCSERFALALREYDAAIALALQQQEPRVRGGLLHRASRLLREALEEWPRLLRSPHAERTLGKLESAVAAPAPAASTVDF